ncbi:hypothetical protein Taro_017338, partial [Colocasia esculenta]|nr:hypothetical protein [Colocasia esculenta]
PQQTNGTECGFFVLYFIYHFIQNDPPTFSLDDYPSFVSYAPLSNYIAEFEKFVHDLIIRKIEVQEVVVEVSKKKHRGATKLSSAHGLDNGKRIVVQINELGQPVGEGGHSLKLFLGTIVRLGDKMSIDAPTWRTMSATHKDDVWEYVQTKLQEVKITQPSSSSSSSIASADDIYSQVFGKERPGRVRRVGTGLTPTKLAERLGKVESIVVESKQVESTPNMERCVQSFASVIEPKGKESLMLGTKVKLCDMAGQPVANAIIMSLDKSKMVMGKILGEEYYEVAILFAYKPNAPLFVKDNERKPSRMLLEVTLCGSETLLS